MRKRFLSGCLLAAALLNGLAACTQAELPPLPTITLVPASQTPEIAETATRTPRPSATARPTRTATVQPTLPPEGIFSLKIYPLLILTYDSQLWADHSQSDDSEKMVNYLQHRRFSTCLLAPLGPSGYFPENMDEKVIGDITCQVALDQKLTNGELASHYFALSSAAGNIQYGHNDGIAVFSVTSSAEEAADCRAAAEEVLATLRRSTP
jgi:hypothetical protein